VGKKVAANDYTPAPTRRTGDARERPVRGTRSANLGHGFAEHGSIALSH
jgi:hypothetical protein